MKENKKYEMFEKNGETLYGLSKELIDYDLALYAVKKMRMELNYVPYELIDEKMIFEAIGGLNWPEDFACFHLAKIDRSLALKMVKINGMAISLVPGDMLNRDIILEAVKEDGMALEVVPKNKIDREIASEAVKCKKSADIVGSVLSEVPEKLLDREMLFEAVRNGGDVEEIFRVMISKKGQSIDGLIDRKIALEMVKNDGKAIEYVPDEIRNEEIILEAIKNRGEEKELVYCVESLSDLDLPAKNDLLMKMAKLNAKVLGEVCRDYEIIFDVSDEEANKNIKYIVLETVKQNGLALQFVTSEIMDKEVALTAVKQNGLALEFVSNEIIDKEIALAAVKQNGLALEFVPSEIMDEDIALEAVKQNSLALKLVPSEIMNENIAVQGIKENIEALKYLKEYISNKEFREAILPVLNEVSASESSDDTKPKRR